MILLLLSVANSLDSGKRLLDFRHIFSQRIYFP